MQTLMAYPTEGQPPHSGLLVAEAGKQP